MYYIYIEGVCICIYIYIHTQEKHGAVILRHPEPKSVFLEILVDYSHHEL